MAYDRRTRQAVLFGGYDGQSDLGDTWLWDGATGTWTQANPARSPKAVTGPMVFTGLRGRVDEFGGFSGNLYENTMWEWKRNQLAASAYRDAALRAFLRRGRASITSPTRWFSTVAWRT